MPRLLRHVGIRPDEVSRLSNCGLGLSVGDIRKLAITIASRSAEDERSRRIAGVRLLRRRRARSSLKEEEEEAE